MIRTKIDKDILPISGHELSTSWHSRFDIISTDVLQAKNISSSLNKLPFPKFEGQASVY